MRLRMFFFLAALAAVLGAAGAPSAALLENELKHPLIAFDNQGTTAYDSLSIALLAAQPGDQPRRGDRRNPDIPALD